MRFQQVVEVIERSCDLGIRTVDQLLDGKAGLVPEDVGELQHCTAGFLLLLDPVSSLLFGLPLSPGLKELRHARNIGHRGVAGNPSRNPSPVYPVLVDTKALRARVEELIRRHDLIAPGSEVTCLVSGGADSTCL